MLHLAVDCDHGESPPCRRLAGLSVSELSERARRHALEIANDADIRVRAPNKKVVDPEAFLKVTARLPKPHDSRLPPPGAWLERNYRGQRIAIKVPVDGFEFEGRVYKTLTTAVNQATGGGCNGFAFFWAALPGEVNHAQE